MDGCWEGLSKKRTNDKLNEKMKEQTCEPANE